MLDCTITDDNLCNKKEKMDSFTIFLIVLVFAYILFYLRASVYKREGFYHRSW